MDPKKHACMHWSLQTIGGFAAPFSKFEVWDQLKTASFKMWDQIKSTFLKMTQKCGTE
jgi:hypothetical protein